jgi:NADH-quinone oxidoreductase subunit A
MLFLYLPILIFFFFSFLISFIIFLASYFLIKNNLDIEKISSYECGFEPFNDARKKIDIRFYLIAILFIIFDLEIAYLFP